MHAVGVLVASELKRALHAIDYAVDHHGPTPPEVNIATPIWQDRGEALAVDVHPEVWQNLDEAYAAIEVLNKHAANIKEDIPNNAGAIVFTARKMLADDLDRIPPNRGPRRAMRFWTKLAAYSAVAALLILGVSSLVAPRANLTSSTIATYLEHELEFSSDATSVDYVVDCDPQGDDWACVIDRVPQTRRFVQ